MQKIIGFIAGLLMLVATVAYADVTSGDLPQLLKNMHSMQADFVQTMVDKNGKTIQTSTGHMSLQRPNQFRWDVHSPNRQLLVTNGKRLWIYDPDLEQVTIRALSKAAGETPAMLLSDENLAVDKEFSVRAVGKVTDALQWFLLIPKDKSSVISSLKLGFQDRKIKQMQLLDHLGNKTLIVFGHSVFNAPLSSALFIFKPPAHIDVIDETKQ